MKIYKLLICAAVASVLSTTAMDGDDRVFNPAEEIDSVQSAWNNVGDNQQLLKPALDRVSAAFSKTSSAHAWAIHATIKVFENYYTKVQSQDPRSKWCADLKDAPGFFFAGLKAPRELQFILKRLRLARYENIFDERDFKNVSELEGFEAAFKAMVEPLGSYGCSALRALYYATGMADLARPDLVHVQTLFAVVYHRWNFYKFQDLVDVVAKHKKDYQLPVEYMIKTLGLLAHVMVSTHVDEDRLQQSIVETLFANQSDAIVVQIISALQMSNALSELEKLKRQGAQFGLLQQRKSHLQALEANKIALARAQADLARAQAETERSEAVLSENTPSLMENSGE